VDIDAYQLCPCQSGKKIKFCCGKEVINDLNDILKKNASGQTQAAIDRLDRTVDRVGEKDCLLVIKTHILIAADQVDAAKSANKKFRKNSPGHPMGMQHLALLDLTDGRVEDAVNSLQDSMDANKSGDIPLAVSNVFKIVASALVDNDKVIAGLAHLDFAQRLRNQPDDDIAEMYSAMVREWSFYPFLFQRNLLEPTPEGVAWGKLYSNVDRAVERGQFRKALQYLMKIDAEHEDHPVVTKALAVIKSYLGTDDAAEAWRRYAAIDGLNSTMAAEAEAFAYIDDASWQVTDPILKLTFAIEDLDSVSEKMIANKSFEALETPSSLPDGTPPPRLGFAVLSQPLAEKTEGLTVADVALRIGNIEVYGKQTDRPARVDVWAASSRIDQVKQVLSSSDVGLDSPEEETIQEDSIAQDTLLSAQSLLPAGVDPVVGDQLILDQKRERFLQEFTNLKLDKDHDLTIREAAKDPKLVNRVYARIMILLSNSKSRFAPEGILPELVQELGLPALDATTKDDHAVLQSPIRFRSLDLSTLSLDELSLLEVSGMGINDAAMVDSAITEHLTRDDRDQKEDAVKLMSLAKCKQGIVQTLDCLEKAIAAARQAEDRKLIGFCLLDEFDIRVFLQQLDRAKAIIAELQAYTDIDEVKYGLTRMLSSHGLLDQSTSVDRLAQMPI
jgi:hypothetical protein